MAAYIAASEGLGIASTIKDNFKFLHKAGIINESLLKKMRSMVGFRNIAVHDYQSIDVDVLKSILKNNLKDIEEFYTVIINRFIKMQKD